MSRWCLVLHESVDMAATVAGMLRRANVGEPILAHNIAAARERALSGRPVAVDPAVRRWPNDLREAVVRQPAIIMGQPRR